jgi:hypothetical protein
MEEQKAIKPKRDRFGIFVLGALCGVTGTVAAVQIDKTVRSPQTSYEYVQSNGWTHVHKECNPVFPAEFYDNAPKAGGVPIKMACRSILTTVLTEKSGNVHFMQGEIGEYIEFGVSDGKKKADLTMPGGTLLPKAKKAAQGALDVMNSGYEGPGDLINRRNEALRRLKDYNEEQRETVKYIYGAG